MYALNTALAPAHQHRSNFQCMHYHFIECFESIASNNKYNNDFIPLSRFICLNALRMI